MALRRKSKPWRKRDLGGRQSVFSRASRLAILLEPYHSSPGKRLIKTPKLYFADSGLLIYLLGFTSWAAVIQNAVWGALWENLVVAEAWRYFLSAGNRPIACRSASIAPRRAANSVSICCASSRIMPGLNAVFLCYPLAPRRSPSFRR